MKKKYENNHTHTKLRKKFSTKTKLQFTNVRQKI